MSVSRVEDWVKKNNDIPYEETSALDGSNVENAFTMIANKLLRHAIQADPNA